MPLFSFLIPTCWQRSENSCFLTSILISVRLKMQPSRLRPTPSWPSVLRDLSRKWPATKRILGRPRLRWTACWRSFGKWKTRRMTRTKRSMSWRGGWKHVCCGCVYTCVDICFGVQDKITEIWISSTECGIVGTPFFIRTAFHKSILDFYFEWMLRIPWHP